MKIAASGFSIHFIRFAHSGGATHRTIDEDDKEGIKK